MPLLEAVELSYRTADGKLLYDGLSFALPAGKLLLVTGPNGSGKSTLIRLILRQLLPTGGAIRIGVDPGKVAFIPQMQNQEFHLPLTLGDVISISQDRAVSASEVEGQGLLQPSEMSLMWNTASGGERQKTLLTCALLQQPDLLILDEPLNHLDRGSRKSMVETIRRYLLQGESARKSVVLVSHIALDELRRFTLQGVRLDLGSREGGDE